MILTRSDGRIYFAIAYQEWVLTSLAWTNVVETTDKATVKLIPYTCLKGKHHWNGQTERATGAYIHLLAPSKDTFGED